MRKIFTHSNFTMRVSIFSSASFAQEIQEKKGSLGLSLDPINRFGWPGLQLCATAGALACLVYAKASESARFGSWGSCSYSLNYEEVDLVVSSSATYFTISVWDSCLMNEAAYNFFIANQDLNAFIGEKPAEGLDETDAGFVHVSCSLAKKMKSAISLNSP